MARRKPAKISCKDASEMHPDDYLNMFKNIIQRPESYDPGRFDPDEPRYGLPPDVTIKPPETTQLAELIDWSTEFAGLPELWREHSGEGIKVAVLDTGVDANHPDLAGKIIAMRDFTGSPYGEADRVAHGTWCAGFIAANADDTGIRGVAYKSKLIIGKVLNDRGSGQDSWIDAGINWAVEQGADIISMSLGGGRMSERLHQTCIRTAAAGRMLICAAGNDGGPINYPAAWAEACLSVGACDNQGRLTRFSSRGPTLGIVAPGQDMMSTIPGGRYARMTGTSMATPMVAGITALALAKHRISGGSTPLENILHLRETFKRTAKPMPEGYGLVNPAALLITNVVVPPPGGDSYNRLIGEQVYPSNQVRVAIYGK